MNDDAETARLVLLACRRGANSPAAFTSLIRRYERTALAVAFGVLADPHGAGDVVQDAFVRAWQRLGDLKDPSRFGPWLCNVVRHLAIDRCRRHAPPAEPLHEDARPHPTAHDERAGDPAARLNDAELRQQVAAGLLALDDVTRCAVTLRYYDNLSSKEIGRLLDLSPAAVDMRLSRARLLLRDKLAALAPYHFE